MSVGDDFHASEQAAEKVRCAVCEMTDPPAKGCHLCAGRRYAAWQAERLLARTELLQKWTERYPECGCGQVYVCLMHRTEAELARDAKEPTP